MIKRKTLESETLRNNLQKELQLKYRLGTVSNELLGAAGWGWVGPKLILRDLNPRPQFPKW